MPHRPETAPAATATTAQRVAPGPAETPAPADPRAQLSPVDALAQLSFVITGMLERRAAEQDLSLAATRLLGVLRDREPTMNELARMLELDKSSVTGLVDRAERRGLVTRVPSAADRRSVLVRLTAEGQAQVSAAAGLFAADVAGLLDVLPPRDRAALTRLVSRLLAAHAARHGIDLFATAAPPAAGVTALPCGKQPREDVPVRDGGIGPAPPSLRRSPAARGSTRSTRKPAARTATGGSWARSPAATPSPREARMSSGPRGSPRPASTRRRSATSSTRSRRRRGARCGRSRCPR
jgi:MarR family transcriptional regulator, lower aerobic nicotinate degradation pathway regulator